MCISTRYTATYHLYGKKIPGLCSGKECGPRRSGEPHSSSGSPLGNSSPQPFLGHRCLRDFVAMTCRKTIMRKRRQREHSRNLSLYQSLSAIHRSAVVRMAAPLHAAVSTCHLFAHAVCCSTLWCSRGCPCTVLDASVTEMSKLRIKNLTLSTITKSPMSWASFTVALLTSTPPLRGKLLTTKILAQFHH